MAYTVPLWDSASRVLETAAGSGKLREDRAVRMMSRDGGSRLQLREVRQPPPDPVRVPERLDPVRGGVDRQRAKDLAKADHLAM